MTTLRDALVLAAGVVLVWLVLDALWVNFDCYMRRSHAARYISAEHAERFTLGVCIDRRRSEGHWW